MCLQKDEVLHTVCFLLEFLTILTFLLLKNQIKSNTWLMRPNSPSPLTSQYELLYPYLLNTIFTAQRLFPIFLHHRPESIIHRVKLQSVKLITSLLSNRSSISDNHNLHHPRCDPVLCFLVRIAESWHLFISLGGLVCE